MKQRGLTMPQFIVGLCLIGLLCIGGFLPKFTLDIDVEQLYMDFYEDSYDEIKKKAGDFFDWIEEYSDKDKYMDKAREEAKDAEEDYKKDLDKWKDNGGIISVSIFTMPFQSWEHICYVNENARRKANGKNKYDSIKDYKDSLSKSSKKDMEDFGKYWNGLRILSIFFILLWCGLITVALLAWFNKCSRWFPIILSWMTAVLYAVEHIWIYAVSPSKLDGLNALPEGSKDLAVKLLRAVLWAVTGVGFWFWTVGLVLLVGWSIWCLIQKPAYAFGGGFAPYQEDMGFSGMPGGFGADPNGFGQMPGGFGADPNGFGPAPGGFGQASNGFGQAPNAFQGMPDQGLGYTRNMPDAGVGGSPFEVDMQVTEFADDHAGFKVPNGRPAKLQVLRGSLQGAELDMTTAGVVTVGRDPNYAQLILNNPKISRKHCQIRWQPQKQNYLVECFSKNGVVLASSQFRIQQNTSREVQPGEQLMMAEGTEVFKLS